MAWIDVCPMCSERTSLRMSDSSSTANGAFIDLVRSKRGRSAHLRRRSSPSGLEWTPGGNQRAASGGLERTGFAAPSGTSGSRIYGRIRDGFFGRPTNEDDGEEHLQELVARAGQAWCEGDERLAD